MLENKINYRTEKCGRSTVWYMWQPWWLLKRSRGGISREDDSDRAETMRKRKYFDRKTWKTQNSSSVTAFEILHLQETLSSQTKRFLGYSVLTQPAPTSTAFTLAMTSSSMSTKILFWDYSDFTGSGLPRNVTPNIQLSNCSQGSFFCKLSNLLLDPRNEVRNVCIDSWKMRMRTFYAPTYDATDEPFLRLVLVSAEEWTSRVTLGEKKKIK